MELPREWAQMDAQELRDLTATLFSKLSEQAAQLSARDELLARRDQELKHKQLQIDPLTYEMAILKRWRYARRSEQLDAGERRSVQAASDALPHAVECRRAAGNIQGYEEGEQIIIVEVGSSVAPSARRHSDEVLRVRWRKERARRHVLDRVRGLMLHNTQRLLTEAALIA